MTSSSSVKTHHSESIPTSSPTIRRCSPKCWSKHATGSTWVTGARASIYRTLQRILLLFSGFSIPLGACAMRCAFCFRHTDSDFRFLHRHKTPDFTTFSSLLRMATKYKFQEIRSQIIPDLLPAYPTQLSDYKTSSCLGEAVFGSPLPHPNSVLDLFVKCEVSFALPFAYYRACIAGDPALLNASAGETALPTNTLKAALRGQARLKGGEVRLAKRLTLQDCGGWGCSGKTPSGRAQVFNWILPGATTQGGVLEKGDFMGSGYCSQCSQTLAQGLSEAQEETWENLPSYFGLPTWEKSNHHVAPALYLYPLDDSFVPKHIALLQKSVTIGRQTNAETAPARRNGYFNLGALSRQHAEVWEQDGKVIANFLLLSPRLGTRDNLVLQIYIKDVGSSNGTFINGERLSGQGLESRPFELKSDDIVVSRFHSLPTSYTATYSAHIQSGVRYRHCRRGQKNHHPRQGRCPCPLYPQRAGLSSPCSCGATTVCPESTRLCPLKPPLGHDFDRQSQ